jgi:hypothetical protein
MDSGRRAGPEAAAGVTPPHTAVDAITASAAMIADSFLRVRNGAPLFGVGDSDRNLEGGTRQRCQRAIGMSADTADISEAWSCLNSLYGRRSSRE